MNSEHSMLTNVFNSRRFVLLMRRDVYLSGRSIVITSITLFLIIVVLSIINNLSRDSGFSHLANFSGILFIGGYVITAKAFIDIHSKSRAYEWFMLPGSILEKFLGRLVITSVGWVVLFGVIYTVASLIGEGLNFTIFGYRHVLFNPFSREVLFAILHYLITQSIFLFGATYFKKNHFIKTLLGIILVGIGIVLVLILVWRVFFADYFPGVLGSRAYEHFMMELDWREFNHGVGRFLLTLGKVIKVVYYSLFAPFFWLLSYLRITGLEVKNGV